MASSFERRSYTVFSLSPVEHEGLNLLWDLKSEDLLPKLASYLIATNADLDDTQKDDLQIFFNSSLVKDPERRSSSLRKLLPLIDPGVKIPGILPLAKQEAASFHEDFEVSSTSFFLNRNKCVRVILILADCAFPSSVLQRGLSTPILHYFMS